MGILLFETVSPVPVVPIELWKLDDFDEKLIHRCFILLTIVTYFREHVSQTVSSLLLASLQCNVCQQLLELVLVFTCIYMLQMDRD